MDGLGGKGGATVCADDVGQAELPEGSLEKWLHKSMPGRREPHAGEAVPEAAIDQGKRVAPLPVKGLELALEVGGPDGVGMRHGGLPQGLDALDAAVSAAA